jgi:hypothetical protein
VTVAEADALAMWVAKTVLMAEFTHPESNATPSDDYHWLFRHRTPPPGMTIWALPTDADDWALRFEHAAVLYGDPAVINRDDPCNTHSTVIGLGRVAFYVTATANLSMQLPSLDDRLLGAVQLWPAVTGFNWRSVSPVGSEDLYFLRDFLRLWIGDDDEQFLGRLTDLAVRRSASSESTAAMGGFVVPPAPKRFGPDAQIS